MTTEPQTAAPLSAEHRTVLDRMRADLGKYDAYHDSDVAVLLRIIDRLEAATRARSGLSDEDMAVAAMTTEPQTAPLSADEFDRTVRNLAIHTPFCSWTERGQPCDCGLTRLLATLDAAQGAATRARSGLDADVESLASIEHEQWMTWARSVMSADDVTIGPERLARWQSYMVPYADLPEHVKEHDRVWARAALASSGEAAPVDGLREALLDIAENANHSPSLHPDGSATHCGPCMAYRVLAQEEADDGR